MSAWVLALTLAVATGGAWAATCNSESDPMDFSVQALAALERDLRFALLTGVAGCGVELVAARAVALAPLSNPDSIDSRFALRNLALRLSEETTIPADARIALLKAAATGFAPEAQATPENLKFDVVMFLKAIQKFQRQRDSGLGLQALVLAIELDRLLPDDCRTVTNWASVPSFRRAYEDVPASVQASSRSIPDDFELMLTLAQVSKGDKSLASLRGGMARNLYFDGFAWRGGDSPEAILRRAGALVRLADEMADVENCECARYWQWKPLMVAGAAYFRLGRVKEGRQLIERATKMARDIPEPSDRLG